MQPSSGGGKAYTSLTTQRVRTQPGQSSTLEYLLMLSTALACVLASDDRDKLLYDVVEMTPPPTSLGMFRLGPLAACGDLISARVRVEGDAEKSEQTFVIKRVSYRYSYERGRYRMVGKGAQVKMASRDAVESSLQRMLPGDDATGASLDGPAA